MKLLSLLLGHSRGVMLLALLAGVVSGAANAGLLALINTALHQDRPWTDPRLVGGFVGLCLSLPVTRAISSYLLATLGQKTVLHLRLQLSRKILAAPLRQLEDLGPHRLLASLTQDVASIVMALSLVPLLSIQLTVVVGSLVYLGWLSWMALVAVVAALALGIVTYRIPISRGARYQRVAREHADQLYSHFGATTSGVKELKLHRLRREALLEDLKTTGNALRRATVRYVTLFSVAAGWGQLAIFGMIGALVFFLPAWQQVDSRTLTGYALILLYMMTPLEAILEALPGLSQARVAFEKIEKLGLSLEAGAPAPGPESGRPPHGGPWRRVDLVGVTHAYQREGEDRSFTLGPIDLSISPGEVVFLIGGNGSGKTTLAKLITGLYVPEQGEVRVDGEPVTDANRDEFMQRFSVVFSDFFLFESLLGLDGPGIDAEAARYLARLQLNHKVTVQDAQLSTTALSQGQRKRLALLTAYLEDRPIYLFDEWAADQDPVFKKVFYLQILPELKRRRKAVLVISHDEHYYGVADRVVKLAHGQLEYDGPPGNLRYSIDAVRVASLEAPADSVGESPVQTMAI
ncbi:MAG TPA: cyclic peptide export ABC transporter [Longimicrobiaceae bacterium]|nr:cyclic peptide export ABC transporter [Longimicrobiaceae bacterium]